LTDLQITTLEAQLSRNNSSNSDPFPGIRADEKHGTPAADTIVKIAFSSANAAPPEAGIPTIFIIFGLTRNNYKTHGETDTGVRASTFVHTNEMILQNLFQFEGYLCY